MGIIGPRNIAVPKHGGSYWPENGNCNGQWSYAEVYPKP